MKKITERVRKTLSRFFRVISVSAASLILQACYGIIPPDESYAEYGMPPPDHIRETSIQGKVSDKAGAPIPGINVSIEKTDYWERTDKNGNFYFWIPVQEEYKLKFEDIDGAANGGLFKGQTQILKQNDTYRTLLISMDLDK